MHDTRFSRGQGEVRLLRQVDGRPSLRNSQLGAIHAVAAHFSLRDEPGLVVLPTGAGKTAVLMLLPYVVAATRVLVITPSKFVRNQIALDYSSLKTLKLIGALPMDVPAPRVKENTKVIRSSSQWETLREFDVVVTTPNAASPAKPSVASPPLDLFDVILVDEAHHSPAKTWNALIEAFPSAKTILFTATPFRRDRREIRARNLYTYPIQRAFEDGIYGDMMYVPVTPSVGTSPDVALAQRAEQILLEDREAGHEHSLFIRADSRRRANELTGVYESETGLRLAAIHSGLKQSTVMRSVELLRSGDLDGVIAVDMLGEGFDLPRLKVAALHAPHRSLAVTLQFFGRFARVGSDLGRARFLAVPEEISGELDELFVESDAWGRRLRLIGQEAIMTAVDTQEVLQRFEDTTPPSHTTPIADISLFGFNVFNHVKVHQVHGDVDLHAELHILGFETVKTWVNEEELTLVFLLREELRPGWATTPGLESVEYQLIIVYWNAEASLLFICSSHREDALYREVTDALVDGRVRGLSLNKTNRVLRPFRNLELFNVGIRNRATGLVAESYRQISGSAAHDALEKGDAALYHRGHIFGRGETSTGTSTIGISSLGKIWRLEHTKIPQLISWCKVLAENIANPAPFKTGIAIDHFDVGVDITELPDVPILAADWDEQLYQRPWKIVQSEAPENAARSILDSDLSVRPERFDATTIEIVLDTESFRTLLHYQLDPVPSLRYRDDNQPRIDVVRGFGRKDLLELCGDEHLRFHLSDGSVIQGSEMFSAMGEEEIPFDIDGFATSVDWAEVGVDPTKEFEHGDDPCAPPSGDDRSSIHFWLASRLSQADTEVLIYDHRSGECADFVSVSESPDQKPLVEFYHAKASGGPSSGDRVGDAFDVCGQAVKSTKFRNRKLLLRHLRRRVREGSRFMSGDEDALLHLLEADPRYELPLRIFIVQPGFPKTDLSGKLGVLLMSVNRALISQGCEPLRVICSP